MPRITYDYIKNLDPASLGKLNKAQMVDLLKKVRAKYQTRAKQLSRVSDKVYSPALEKMEAYYDGKVTAPSRISRAKAYNEIINISSFFQSRSSTVKGSKEIMREQDIRIFGKNSLGRAKHTMSVDERSRFWSFYNEFLNTYKNAEFLYGSGRVQQFLGDMFLQDKKSGKSSSTELSPDKFRELLSEMQTAKEIEEDEEEYEFRNGDVYSSRRDNY